jgi:pimeloyl-ACP methyl ester carboxylesterase
MYQAEALRDNALVVALDLPGFGGSSGLAGPYDLARLAGDVGSLLEELELQDVVVGGFAFGASVAMTLAALSPARVRSLVLVGVPSGAYAPYARMPGAMRRDWPDFARRSARAICKQPQSEATFEWLERMFGSTPLPVAIETVGILESFDPLELAPVLEVPSVFVHGAEDDVVPVEVAQACVESMGDARLEVVQKCGHLVPLDQPAAMTAALGAALEA